MIKVVTQAEKKKRQETLRSLPLFFTLVSAGFVTSFKNKKRCLKCNFKYLF